MVEKLEIEKVVVTVTAHLSNGQTVDQKITIGSVYESRIDTLVEAVKYIFDNVLKKAKELTK